MKNVLHLVMVLVGLPGIRANAQDNPSSTTCYPNPTVYYGTSICDQNTLVLATTSGELSTGISGTCSPSGRYVSATSGVGVFNCSRSVTLWVHAGPLFVSQGAGEVRTSATAQWGISGYVYWNAWDDQFCDGYRNRYIQGPTPC
jgi:hypothetical protein